MNSISLSTSFGKKRLSCENVAKVSDYLYNSTNLSQWMYLSEKLRNCGTMLSFAVDPCDIEYEKLVDANFCRHRMCPMCGWRRSLRVYSNVRDMFDVLLCKEKLHSIGLDSYCKYNFRFLFITLTVPNCIGDILSLVLDDMMKSFRESFIKSKKIKDVCLGYYRTVEVTYNSSTDTFHPHIHCIMAVSKDYFRNGQKYLSTHDIKVLWKNACRMGNLPTADGLPICNIKAVYGGDTLDRDEAGESNRGDSVDVSSVLAEISKYCVKSKDYDDVSNLGQSSYVLEILDDALRSRRLIGYGGVFKKIRSILKQNDENLFDLVDDQIEEAVNCVVVSAVWCQGFSQYKIFEIANDDEFRQEKKFRKEVANIAIRRSADKFRYGKFECWHPE